MPLQPTMPLSGLALHLLLVLLPLAFACGSGTAGSGANPSASPTVDPPSPSLEPTPSPTVSAPAPPSPTLRSGELDPGFGDDGAVRALAPGRRVAVVDGALQPGGRIVLLLDAADPERADQNVIGLARHLANGPLDPSFGQGGFIAHAACSEPSGACRALRPRALLALPDGRLLITVGDDRDGLASRLLLMTADGVPDPSFGDEGVVTVPALIEDLALLDDGGVVAVGGSPNGYVLLRLTSDLVLDPQFGVNGLRSFDIARRGLLQVFHHVAVQRDGKVIAAGLFPAPNLGPVVARFTSDGEPDEDFGEAGWLIGDAPSDLFRGVSAAAGPIALDRYDRLLVETLAGFTNRHVQRLDLDGSVDSSWTAPFESAHSLFVQADGGVLATSVRRILDFGFVVDIQGVLRRYDQVGVADPSFGDDGLVFLPLIDGRPVFVDAALEQGDRIVVASSVPDGGWVLFRFLK